MTNDITPLATSGESGPETTSLIVSEGTEVEHRAVLQLIRNNLADFEEFGTLAFQMRKSAGRPTEFAVLNEEQATLLLTYMRNSDIVRQFKKNLVRAFYELRNRQQQPALQGPELLAAALLIEKDWIYVQTDSRWSNTKGKKVERNRYSEKATKKRYFRRVENHEAPRFRGSEVMHTLKITPQGAEAIARLVAKESAA